MFDFLPARWLAVSAVFAALHVSAQTTTPLEDYRPFNEVKLSAWKDANDTVNKIGGWRTYAKETHESQAPDRPVPSTGNAPISHAEHGKPNGGEK